MPIVREVNQWLKEYCASGHLVYLDDYTAVSDPTGAILHGLSSDGVHPTAAGYAVMALLAEGAIRHVLMKTSR